MACFSAKAFSRDACAFGLASTFFNSRFTAASNSPTLRCFCANGPQQGGLVLFRGMCKIYNKSSENLEGLEGCNQPE
jgi:hypothetical protein